MFILHSSNKTENLLEHLAVMLRTLPLSSPLAEEVFLIQGQGMERWLSQQLAGHFKVWGNFCYLFPGKFFSQLGRLLQVAGNDDAFERHKLLWTFEALLRDSGNEAFRPLRQYLQGEQAELKRYQLARELARIFDQYQLLRPDLLEAWRQGRKHYRSATEDWQCLLWQAVVADWGDGHRGACWLAGIDRLRRAEPGMLDGLLPERVSVFGIHSMPPLLLAYLQALSRHCDVHLYLLNPVQAYWADLPGRRLAAQLADFSGHPLLVALGQQGREFQQLLLEQGEFDFEPVSFQPAAAASNLGVLQDDILGNCQPAGALQADGSIGVHACHSRWREVQVLKQQLLACLEEMPDLELRDIVVMAPDIQVYAPFIAAEFADIQHAIADRSLPAADPAVKVLLDFLAVVQGRLGWQSVLDLLEQALVCRSFALGESDLALVRHWLADTSVRWGGSAAHRQALDLPALAQNTWQAALDRLYLGFALGSEDAFVGDVLPYKDIEGNAAQALGGLDDFMRLLFQAGEQCRHPQSLRQWQGRLTAYADRLLAAAEPAQRLALAELLANLDVAAESHDQPVGVQVIQAWLQERLADCRSSHGFLRGQLTFCSMLPMRAIPFQVVALLGMNDGEFPRLERDPGFDLLLQQPRLGDRSRRADERYQFLEALLSARRRLLITFIGRSQRDNADIPPSVLVSELLDLLRDGYGLDGVLVNHPLHAFSGRCFAPGDHAVFSYEQHDLLIARQLAEPVQPAADWWQGELPADPQPVIGIAELLQFFSHPQRYFFRQRLGVGLPQPQMDDDEREPFALDPLQRYAVQQQWLTAELAGSPLSAARLQAMGQWPAGAPGEVAWLRQQPGIARFAAEVRDTAPGAALPHLPVDIALGEFRLVGTLRNLYQHGSLCYRYAALKGGDLLAAWLQHLLINRVQPQTTYLLGREQKLVFAAGNADPAILLELVRIYKQGWQRPDAFFTQAAFIFLNYGAQDAALLKVAKDMQDLVEKGYEPEIAKLWPGRNLQQLFTADFAEQCRNLLLPAWESRQ